MKNNLFDLEQETAVVVGGTGVLQHLAQRGHRVSIAAHFDRHRLQGIASSLRATAETRIEQSKLSGCTRKLTAQPGAGVTPFRRTLRHPPIISATGA